MSMKVDQVRKAFSDCILFLVLVIRVDNRRALDGPMKRPLDATASR